MGVDQAWRSINAAYEEWAEHLGNPNFCRQGQVLTWQSRQRIWLRNEFDSSAYQQLAEARQYSFVVADDGGLIQLHYEFDGDVLLKASAGYYGSSQITLIEREVSAAEDAYGIDFVLFPCKKKHSLLHLMGGISCAD